MVSDTSAQDAARVPSLVPDCTKVTPTEDDPIVTLRLQKMVKLWSGRKTNDTPPQPAPLTFEYLRGLYVTHHAWAWEHDPWTGGAFALFGPGQFKNVYPNFNTLFCNKKLALCGEALSAHHAWISEAIDSAYNVVQMWKLARGSVHNFNKLKEAKIFGNGPGEHAEEMDEELVKRAVILGEGGGPEEWDDEWRFGKRRKP